MGRLVFTANSQEQDDNGNIWRLVAAASGAHPSEPSRACSFCASASPLSWGNAATSQMGYVFLVDHRGIIRYRGCGAALLETSAAHASFPRCRRSHGRGARRALHGDEALHSGACGEPRRRSRLEGLMCAPHEAPSKLTGRIPLGAQLGNCSHHTRAFRHFPTYVSGFANGFLARNLDDVRCDSAPHHQCDSVAQWR